MKKDLLKRINACILQAKNGKSAYFEGIQKGVELYLENFDSFNGNITPLKSLFDVCKKDAITLRDYIYKVTNITFMGFIKNKDGSLKLSLKIAGDFALNENYGKCKWYDREEKTKIEKILNDDALVKSLQAIYKRYSKDNSEVAPESLNAVNNLIKRLSKGIK